MEGSFSGLKYFLGNKTRHYTEIVTTMLTAFSNLGCNMNIKILYSFLHMDWFPEDLGSMREEQQARFHQDMRDQIPGTLGCSHDGWLLLDSEERPPY